MVYIPEEKLNCSSNTDDTTTNDNTVITQENRKPLVLPSGCLSSTVLKLSCKGIQESKYYSFDLSNRMISGDTISKVEVYPNDDTVTGTQATYDKQTFKVLLAGGEGITNVGILFIITTLSGEVLEFTCVLPIRPEGVLQVGLDANYVMGGQGGNGVTPTIVAGNTNTLAPGEAAAVNATTTGTTTVFDFSVPQGPKGDAGSRWYSGETAPDASTGLDDEKGAPRPGDMYLYLDSEGHDASTYILTNDKNWAGPLATVAGPQGAPGLNGKDGATYTFKVGTISSLEAGSAPTVEYVVDEDTYQITVNYGIPKGSQGPQGEKGDTGATGAQGPQGDAVLSDADQGNFDTIVDAFALNETTQVSPVDTALSQNSTSAYSYYTMQAQSAWQGRLVTQIGFKVATAGIITVSLLENPNSSDFSIIKQVKITVDKDTIWYDLNWSVGDKQYIAVCEKGDTGLFKYANYQGEAGKGYYVYVPGASPYWALNQINLNIGIKIKNIQTLIDVSTINAYLTDKNVSFLGDSVTTFKGYVPSGYAVYYPTGDVQSVSKTWWKQFLNKTGGTLLTNNSYSGSYVSSNGPGSLQTRLTGIDAKTDVCLIFMGTNDFGNGVTLGDFDPTKTTFDTTQFTDAVCNTIIQLTTTYPTTKFVWLTPTKRFANGTYPTINGHTQDEFTDRIIEVCNYYGMEYLDMRGVGLTLYNKGKYTGDGSLHPNALGHTLFFNYIYRNLFKILG